MQSELSLLEQVKRQKIWDFPGGIHPPEQKSLSNELPIATMPLLKRYYVSVKQHIGSTDDVIVKVGDTVKTGQALTGANLTMTVPVHSPVSGKVSAIAPHVSAHPSAKPEMTVIIDADDVQQSVDPKPLSDWQNADKDTLIDQIKQMGISGMGGAGFPTHIKMHPKKDIDVLILNAVECEPYITADDTLMREHATDIVTGTKILQHIVNAKVVLIGIEDNKPEAIAAMKAATSQFDDIEVRVVPTKYPSGGEKQLIQVLTGLQVPSGGIPADLGIVMQNTGTAFAVKQAVIDGLPLTQRVVTITGERVNKAQNVWAKLGSPVSDLLEFAGFEPEQEQRVIMGGPMMGFAILDPSMPVVKTTNCILAPSSYKLPPQGEEQACIRCGLCADACPADLLPQQLQWFAKAKDHEKLEEYNLFDCIECGACAYVCPSQIPLVQYYRSSKAEIREAEQERIKSEKAKVRFEQRQARLEREKQERLEKHKAAAEKRAKAMEKDTGAKDKIAAALARAKAKKEQKSETVKDEVAQNTEASAQEPMSQKDKVAAALARAKAKKAAKAAEVAKEKDSSQATDAQDSASESSMSQKDKVAAAVARAKAKKAAKAAEEAKSNNTSPSSEERQEQTKEQSSKATKPEISPEEQARKDKVAEAIARAKAKKAEKQAQEQQRSNADNSASTSDDNAEAKTPEQIRKEKVAAAIAKAKAKKAEGK